MNNEVRSSSATDSLVIKGTFYLFYWRKENFAGAQKEGSVRECFKRYVIFSFSAIEVLFFSVETIQAVCISVVTNNGKYQSLYKLYLLMFTHVRKILLSYLIIDTSTIHAQNVL